MTSPSTENTRRALINAIDAHVNASGPINHIYRFCIDSAPHAWLVRELARIEGDIASGANPFDARHIDA